MADLIPIVIDTREQAPYAFNPNRFRVECRALPACKFARDVVEGSMRDVLDGPMGQGRTPTRASARSSRSARTETDRRRGISSRRTSNAARGPPTKATFGKVNVEATGAIKPCEARPTCVRVHLLVRAVLSFGSVLARRRSCWGRIHLHPLRLLGRIRRSHSPQG